MKLIVPLFFVIFILFAVQKIPCQTAENDKPVAKIGDISISKDEFQERYEMTPVFRKHITRMRESLKLEFLYSLIAEKLWAQDAEKRHLDTASVIEFATNEFEKMFVRDALYKKDIRDKVTVTEKEIDEALIRNNTKLEINYLISDDEKEIYNLYNLLKQGIPFDSILAVSPELDEQKNPVEVVFGQMQLDIEDSLYNLKVGQYTSPMNTPDGWYIFRLTNKIPQVLNTDYEREQSRNATKKIIAARKERQLYYKFFENFFKDIKVDINANIFRGIASKLSDIFTGRRIEYKIPEKDPVYMEPGDVHHLEDQFGSDSLNIDYIKFNVDPVPLDKFLKLLAFDGFKSVRTDYRSIVHELNIKTKSIMEQELLARKGYEEGLNLLPSVQNDLKMWKENYLYQYLQNKFVDAAAVSDSEVYSEYLNNNKEADYPAEVNIVEILTDDLDTVSIIMKEIKEGKDMHELAEKYSIRGWTKAKKGEFGFFPVTAYGEIGKIAAGMEVGEIYGPLKVPEGYSIFKVIGKREPRKEDPQPFAKLKDTIKRSLEYNKAKSAIINYTVQLAKKYGVEIFPTELSSVEVTDINSFGFRFLGFGGKITAVPLTAPNVDWVDKYIQSNTLNQ